MELNTCIEAITESGILPDECLNDWPVMRRITANHIQLLYDGEPAEILPSLQREMKRLQRLWQVARESFRQEVVSWYAV